jgi:ankyrin repeat protein
MLRAFYAAALSTFTLLWPTPAQCQVDDPQAQLWDGAIQGDTSAMAAALARGAVIDSLDTRRNRNGRRALNWAAWYNQVPAIHFLLGRGAPLEARNHTGFTALHHAAEAGSVEALEVLLAAGADPQAANTAGRLPMETARRQGHEAVVVVLEKAIRSPKANQQ